MPTNFLENSLVKLWKIRRFKIIHQHEAMLELEQSKYLMFSPGRETSCRILDGKAKKVPYFFNTMHCDWMIDHFYSRKSRNAYLSILVTQKYGRLKQWNPHICMAQRSNYGEPFQTPFISLNFILIFLYNLIFI